MVNTPPPYGPPTSYPAPPYYVAPPPRARGRFLLVIPGSLFLVGGTVGALAFLMLSLVTLPVWWELFHRLAYELPPHTLSWLLITGALLLLLVVLFLVAGILGTLNYNRPEKASACIVCGVLLIVLMTAVTASTMFLFESLLPLTDNWYQYWTPSPLATATLGAFLWVPALILPSCYLAGALMNRHDHKQQQKAPHPQG